MWEGMWQLAVPDNVLPAHVHSGTSAFLYHLFYSHPILWSLAMLGASFFSIAR